MRKVDKKLTAIQTDSALRFSGVEIRLLEHTVYRNDNLISMTRREFQTLVYLAKHPGWVFSPNSIYEEVWKECCGNRGIAVSNVISQIRRN